MHLSSSRSLIFSLVVWVSCVNLTSQAGDMEWEPVTKKELEPAEDESVIDDVFVSLHTGLLLVIHCGSVTNDTAKAVEVTSYLLSALDQARGFTANKARAEAVSAYFHHKKDCPTTRMLLNQGAKQVREFANWALAMVEEICPSMEPWELTV